MDKDIKSTVKWARSQGWTIKTTADGYTQFFDPDGEYVTYYPNTPGNAYRRRKDMEVDLKAAGLEIPPPSKKEQKALRKKADEPAGETEQEEE